MTSTRVAAIAVAAALIGGLSATAVSASFPDVPGESKAAEHIASVQEAGIATGYANGTFRPTNALTRQTGAVWVNRVATRSSLDFADEPSEYDQMSPSDATQALASVDVASPAAHSGGGWVNLQGYVAAATTNPTGAGCPCAFDARIVNDANEVVALGILTAPGDESDDERTTSGPVGISPVTGIVWLPGNTSDTYTLVLELVDSDVASVFVAGTLSATYTPMAEGEPAQHGESAPVDGPVSLSPIQP